VATWSCTCDSGTLASAHQCKFAYDGRFLEGVNPAKGLKILIDESLITRIEGQHRLRINTIEDWGSTLHLARDSGLVSYLIFKYKYRRITIRGRLLIKFFLSLS
jgi:hypothetical protein